MINAASAALVCPLHIVLKLCTTLYNSPQPAESNQNLPTALSDNLAASSSQYFIVSRHPEPGASVQQLLTFACSGMASGVSSAQVEGCIVSPVDEESSDDEEVEVFSEAGHPPSHTLHESLGEESESEPRLVAAMASAVRAVESEKPFPSANAKAAVPETEVLPVQVEKSTDADAFGIVYQQRRIIPLVEVGSAPSHLGEPSIDDDEFDYDDEGEESEAAVQKALERARLKALEEPPSAGAEGEEDPTSTADQGKAASAVQSSPAPVNSSPSKLEISPVVPPSIVKETIPEVDEEALDEEDDDAGPAEQTLAAEAEWEQLAASTTEALPEDLYADLSKQEDGIFEPITYHAALEYLK